MSVLVMAVGSCSDDAQEPGDAAPPTAADDPAVNDDARQPADAQDRPAEAEDLTDTVLATATGVDGSTPLRLELHAGRRQGETVSITFGVANEGTER
jgi:hypothetical protein